MVQNKDNSSNNHSVMCMASLLIKASLTMGVTDSGQRFSFRISALMVWIGMSLLILLAEGLLLIQHPLLLLLGHDSGNLLVSSVPVTVQWYPATEAGY